MMKHTYWIDDEILSILDISKAFNKFKNAQLKVCVVLKHTPTKILRKKLMSTPFHNLIRRKNIISAHLI